MLLGKRARIGLLFWIGFMMYISIEVIYRGHSHWSMGLAGGICFLFIGGLNQRFNWETDVLVQMIISMLFITALEFFAGVILNIWLKLDIWDYSALRFNLLGQISITYSLLWLPLSLVGIVLDDWLRHYLFGEQVPCYKLLGRRIGGVCS